MQKIAAVVAAGERRSAGVGRAGRRGPRARRRRRGALQRIVAGMDASPPMT